MDVDTDDEPATMSEIALESQHDETLNKSRYLSISNQRPPPSVFPFPLIQVSPNSVPKKDRKCNRFEISKDKLPKRNDTFLKVKENLIQKLAENK